MPTTALSTKGAENFMRSTYLPLRAPMGQLATLSPLIFVPFRSQKAMWIPSSLSVSTHYDLSRTSFFFPSEISLN
jgi:hypothetical protein